MKYEVIKIGSKKYALKETKTENILRVYRTLKQANEIKNSLVYNNIGFCGWTPTFMLKLNKKIA